MKKVAIIGTNGLPANYGGFETLAENIVKQLKGRYSFIVYCRKTPREKQIKSFHEARLVYLPFLANGWQSFLFDSFSIFHAWFKADILLILGPAAGIILPLNVFFRKKIIVNHGGLNEWEREKYSSIEKRVVWIVHKLAAISSDYNIADNELLRDSIKKNFNCNTMVIRYGGDHAKPVIKDDDLLIKYPFINQKYFISVSRAQIDNNMHLVLDAFAHQPTKILVMISNWNVSKYGKDLYEKYKNHENIILLPAIYNQNELNYLRCHAHAYIHSHSRCGTSPSLVEAISLDLPVISFNVPTNRETTKNSAVYFDSSLDLQNLILGLDETSIQNLQQNTISIKHNYYWRNITKSYAQLFDD